MLKTMPTGRGLVDAERRVHRLMRREFSEALFDLGVSFAHFEVMELLHTAGRLHPGGIGHRLLITRQAAHRLVRQLKRNALVETWRLEGSGVGVRLTAAGRQSVARWSDALRPTFALIDRLDEERRTQLLRHLTAWEYALQPHLPWWVRPP